MALGINYGTVICHTSLLKMVPDKKANMNERNKAIKELDQVRAQIERNSVKVQRAIAAGNKALDIAQAKNDKIYSAAIHARDKANAPLERRARFLTEEVKQLI